MAGSAIGAQAATTGTGVGYQQSATHDGNQPDGMLVPPLANQWQRNLGGPVSYPVIANGVAYVTVANVNAYGTKLYALDASTGDTVWGPVDLGGTYSFSAVTYDAGAVFALNYNGILRAFDAATGVSLWTIQLPGQYAFTSPPTALNGLVYTGGAGSGGTVYAVRESDGTLSWTASVMNGDHSSPAVTPTGVYVAYACNQVYDFDPGTGALIWHHDGPCEGGGGKTVSVHNGRVYTRDYFGNLILDASSGAELGSYSATAAPAFDGNMGFFLNGTSLSAVDEQGTIQWTFTGDGQLDSAPLVDNGYVYAGSASGNVYALSEATGQLAWSATVGSPIQAPDEQNATLLTGFAAAGETLLVPARATLTGFGEARPSITAAASGTLGANGWYTSGVTVHFTCTAGSYPITSCPADVTLNKQGAGQVVSGTATDTAGMTASTSLTVNIDKSPPSAVVTSSDTVNSSVDGTASDHVSGVATVSVTFTSATGTVTEPASLSSCGQQNTNCVDWSAVPPAGLFGTGAGATTVWSGTVTATAVDAAGLTYTTAPTNQTLIR